MTHQPRLDRRQLKALIHQFMQDMVWEMEQRTSDTGPGVKFHPRVSRFFGAAQSMTSEQDTSLLDRPSRN